MGKGHVGPIAIVIIVCAVTVLLFLFRKRLGQLLPTLFGVPMGLDVLDPPMEPRTAEICKSSIGNPTNTTLRTTSARVVLATDEVKGVPLGEGPVPTLDRMLLSLGDPRKGPPSAFFGKGAKFELNIWFWVHNLLDEEVHLNDVKVDVYHASMYRARLAMIPWAPRLELAVDNTTRLTAAAMPIRRGCAQPIHLVFESSVFDTLFTTVVFGMTVDYSVTDAGATHKYRVPSDKIYIFQHDHHWGATRCHFVARDAAEITHQKALSSGQYSQFFDSLEQIFGVHSARGTQRIDGPASS